MRSVLFYFGELLLPILLTDVPRVDARRNPLIIKGMCLFNIRNQHIVNALFGGQLYRLMRMKIEVGFQD